MLHKAITGVPLDFVAAALQNPLWEPATRIVLPLGVFALLIGLVVVFRIIGAHKELKKMVSSGNWYSLSMMDAVSKFEEKLWNLPLIGFFLAKRMMPWLSALRCEAKKKRIGEIYEDALKCAKDGRHKLAVEYFAAMIRLLPPEEREQWGTRLSFLVDEMIAQSRYKITLLTAQAEALENIRKSVPFVCDVSKKLCLLFEVEGALDVMPD